MQFFFINFFLSNLAFLFAPGICKSDNVFAPRMCKSHKLLKDFNIDISIQNVFGKIKTILIEKIRIAGRAEST